MAIQYGRMTSMDPNLNFCLDTFFFFEWIFFVFVVGFEKPSAIQQRSILPIVKGRDVIAQAQSGKLSHTDGRFD